MAPVFSKPIYYAPVPEYEHGYWATSCGDVWSLCTKKFLRPALNNPGYKHVSLYKDGKKRTVDVHRIIATTFVPNDDPEKRTQVDHINHVRTDNRASNLQWASCSENVHKRNKSTGKSSRYHGVCWDNGHERWMATSRSKIIGRFLVEEDAARAHDKAALQHFGDRARLNFPMRNA